jgi:hypothetical protein
MDLASAERLAPQDMAKSHAPDVHHLGDIVLALESGADVADESPLNLQAPEEITQVTPVHDLDVDDELSHLPLGPIVDESGADEDDEETLEYTLEIDEDLEFEVEGLALDQDEEGGEEDDDER